MVVSPFSRIKSTFYTLMRICLKYLLQLWRGGYKDFLSKICCLTVSKDVVGQPFCVSVIFWYRYIIWIKGGGGRDGVSRFSVNFFRLTVPKKFIGEPFSVSLLCVIENFMYKKGGGREVVSRFAVKIFLSHSAKKFRRGSLQCFTNFGYWKILCARWVCHDFRSKFFCHTLPKNFAREPFCVWEKFYYRKF